MRRFQAYGLCLSVLMSLSSAYAQEPVAFFAQAAKNLAEVAGKAGTGDYKDPAANGPCKAALSFAVRSDFNRVTVTQQRSYVLTLDYLARLTKEVSTIHDVLVQVGRDGSASNAPIWARTFLQGVSLVRGMRVRRPLRASSDEDLSLTAMKILDTSEFAEFLERLQSKDQQELIDLLKLKALSGLMDEREPPSLQRLAGSRYYESVWIPRFSEAVLAYVDSGEYEKALAAYLVREFARSR